MSMTIYPAKVTVTNDEDGNTVNEVSPICSFEQMEQFILKPLSEDELSAEADPFMPNPRYVEGAGMTISGGNWSYLKAMLKLEGNLISIDDLDEQITKRGEFVITNESGLSNVLYFADRIRTLRKMVIVGRKMGAAFIAAA